MNCGSKQVFCLLAFAGLFLCSQVVYAEDEAGERDRLGLSQEEWDVYKTLHLSKAKVKRLLSAGITLEEYSGSPWIGMGISEEEWIVQRRAGLKDDEIKGNQIKGESENKLVALSFFLPSYGHYALGQKPLGFLFSGIAVGSVSLYLVHKRKVLTATGTPLWRRQPIYLGVLLANSIVCAADVWRRTRFDDNPDLKEFSFYLDAQKPELGICYHF
jgi:hypothetical protein